MTLEEFRNIISYTTDEQYAKYFDEHILLYEFLKNRFAPGQIGIEVCPNDKSITYKITPMVEIDNQYIHDTLKIMEVSLFDRNFIVRTHSKDGIMYIKLES